MQYLSANIVQVKPVFQTKGIWQIVTPKDKRPTIIRTHSCND